MTRDGGRGEGRTTTIPGDGDVGTGGGSFDFRVDRAEGVTEKCPTGNYGRLSRLYDLKMPGVSPEIYNGRPEGDSRRAPERFHSGIVFRSRAPARSFCLFAHN